MVTKKPTRQKITHSHFHQHRLGEDGGRHGHWHEHDSGEHDLGSVQTHTHFHTTADVWPHIGCAIQDAVRPIRG